MSLAHTTFDPMLSTIVTTQAYKASATRPCYTSFTMFSFTLWQTVQARSLPSSPNYRISTTQSKGIVTFGSGKITKYTASRLVSPLLPHFFFPSYHN